MLDYILFVLAWLFGVIVGSFTLVQMLTVTLFGLPMCCQFRKRQLLTSDVPFVKYAISLIFLGCVFAGGTWLVYKLSPQRQIAYWIGVCVTVLFGFFQIGNTKKHIADFRDLNDRYIDHDRLAMLATADYPS